MRSIHQILNKQYYEKSSWILLLLPLSFIYFLIISFRTYAYKSGIFKSIKMKVPLVVIGNITIGGTGKTPLVIWVLEKLIKLGMKPGLICSGYNSKATSPQEVLIDSKVLDVAFLTVNVLGKETVELSICISAAVESATSVI